MNIICINVGKLRLPFQILNFKKKYKQIFLSHKLEIKTEHFNIKQYVNYI